MIKVYYRVKKPGGGKGFGFFSGEKHKIGEIVKICLRQLLK